MPVKSTAELNPQVSQRFTFILIVLCLVVAALLRLSALDLMEYKIDEAVMIRLVSQVADDGTFLTHGEYSSRGPSHSPLATYLLAPTWAWAHSYLAVVWLIALLNVAAVGVTYWIGQRYLSPRAGLIAAACMAVSPWMVMLSRKIWRPDMMPLFGALLLASTLVLVVEGRRRAIFWVCLWGGVVAQIFPTGYLAVGAVLLFLLLHRPRVSRPALFLGLTVLTILYLPYGIFLAGGGWREFLALLSPRGGVGNPSSWVQKIEPIWHLVNLGNFPYLIGETSYYLDAKLGASALLVYPLATLERWGFIAGFGWLIWRMLSPKGESHLQPVGLIFILWIAFPAVVYLFTPWRPYPHYYMVILPAPFLILGATVNQGLARLSTGVGSTSRYRGAAGILGLALAGIILTQVHFTATLLSLLRAKGGASGEYGVSYQHKVALADYLAKTFGPGCYRLTHEWRPLYGVDVGSEIYDLVRRRVEKRPCPTPAPVQLYLLETVDRPLSPAAEARLGPYRRFGPILLYTKAAKHEP
ncbi:glycosyltransferase family 39 protein [Nitrospinae bacterium AH_259_B05_G02_I21]|nr:glycosyltransferase family 39 protein [Nitrospinae bacterium AH_259_B05_G02_I21]MDA2932590.1 glycosyltransferase family 39 protein [Nitrospinae bacterium AH-259-F20]